MWTAGRLSLLLLVVTFACSVEREPVGDGPRPFERNLFIMYSANAPRVAPALFERYLTDRDYARIESLPEVLVVQRGRRYALPTTLRRRWANEPGVRYWTELGCGPGTPGLIVYDPEHRYLTPPSEMRALPASIRRAARLVASTGCHRFGLAPGSTPFFGLDPSDCSFDLSQGVFRQVPWEAVDLIDIQGQRLLSDSCADEGVETYRDLVSSVAKFVRGHNPGIAVVAQVSFRDNPPARMEEAIASVVDVVDGIYFSYPYSEPTIPCIYCSLSNLRTLLSFLRPRAMTVGSLSDAAVPPTPSVFN